MTTTKALLLTILISSNIPVTCSQSSANNKAPKRTENNWLYKTSKFVFFATLALMGNHIYNSSNYTHNHLDDSRPFTCADITHTFPSAEYPGVRFLSNRVCAHTEKPFGLTEYKNVPHSLQKECIYRHGPVDSTPTWALPGEIESLRLGDLEQEPKSTNFNLICRYSPKSMAHQ